MTANVTFGNNFKGAEEYQANKIVNGVNQSELIYMQNVMPEYEVNAKNQLQEKPLSIAQDMHDHAKSENTKVQKPVMNISFNFHQSENLTNDQMNTAIRSALKEVGINEDNHKFTIRRHYDKPHPHAHVLASRVGLNGKVHDNSFIANRLMVACDKVEKEQYLRPTKGRIFVSDATKEKGYRKVSKQERERRNTPKRTKKDKIQTVHNQIKSEFNAEKKESKNFEEIRERLADKGIQMNIATNKNGVYGLSFRKEDIAVKASKIGIKVKEIKVEFAQNIELYNQRKRHFERQTEKIYQEIEEDLRATNESLGVNVIDQKIKKYISEVEPKKNVWIIIDDYGERRWQDMLHEFSEQKLKELKSIEQSKAELIEQQKKSAEKEKEKRDQEQNHHRRKRRR